MKWVVERLGIVMGRLRGGGFAAEPKRASVGNGHAGTTVLVTMQGHTGTFFGMKIRWAPGPGVADLVFAFLGCRILPRAKRPPS